MEGGADAGLAGAGALDVDGRLIGILLGEGLESVRLQSAGPGASVEHPLSCEGPSEAGWVLPIEEIERAARLMLSQSREGQGFLGVRAEVPPDAPSRAAPQEPGLVVTQVLSRSPAARAGIMAGDRIVSYDGQSVRSWDELTRQVASTSPAQPVKIEVIRNGQRVSMRVQIGDRGAMLWQEKQRALAQGRERQLVRQLESIELQLRLFRDLNPSPR